jgi:hypothetical protein
MNERNIKAFLFFDNESQKGFPTHDSLAITIMYENDNLGLDVCRLGFAVKLPGEQYKKKVGNAIAYTNMECNNFYISSTGDLLEKIIISLDKFILNHRSIVSNKLQKRLLDLRNGIYFDKCGGSLNPIHI